MSNTIKDFKMTAKTRGDIICAACGSSMGLHNPNSFKLILTPAFRPYLQDALMQLRNFIWSIELHLERRMEVISINDIDGYPYEREERTFIEDYFASIYTADSERTNEEITREDALKINTSNKGDFFVTDTSFDLASNGAAELLRSQIDPYDLDKILDELPSVPSDSSNNENIEDICKKIAKVLTGQGLERSNNSLIYELISEQIGDFNASPKVNRYDRNVREFLKGVSNHWSSIDKIVSDVCPALYKYYEFLEKNSKNKAIEENVKRSKILLLMLHGHRFGNRPDHAMDISKKKTPSEFSGSEENYFEAFIQEEYSLPNETVVSRQLLVQILKSRTFLQNKNDLFEEKLGLSQPLTSYLKTKWDSLKVKVTGNDFHLWLSEVDKLVKISCANEIEVEPKIAQVAVFGNVSNSESASDSPHDVPEVEGSDKEKKRVDVAKILKRKMYEPCHWSPSKAVTHSIVILGSRRTGKTSLLYSGLAALSRFQASVGIRLAPEGDLSTVKLNEIVKMNWDGKLSQPTTANFAIKMEVSKQASESTDKTRFIFIDVPGEKVRSLETHRKADPELRRILRNANTIVFQFDVWSDPFILQSIKSNNPEVFKEEIEATESVHSKTDRESLVNQSRLLYDLIDLLIEELGNIKDKRINFICVIPKADKFVRRDDGTSHFFLTPVFEKLQELGVLVPSYHTDELKKEGSFRDYQHMHTVAGAGHLAKNHEGNLLDQLGLCRLISDYTEDNLKNIGNVLRENTVIQNKTALKDYIEKNVIDFIRERFGGEIFFWPVSALGQNPNNEDSLGHTPNQVLAEYVFLLPILLALKTNDDSYNSAVGRG